MTKYQLPLEYLLNDLLIIARLVFEAESFGSRPAPGAKLRDEEPANETTFPCAPANRHAPSLSGVCTRAHFSADDHGDRDGYRIGPERRPRSGRDRYGDV